MTSTVHDMILKVVDVLRDIRPRRAVGRGGRRKCWAATRIVRREDERRGSTAPRPRRR